MRQLEKIFSGWYIDKHKQKELNGIIQLFNCSYLKDQNFDRAIENFSTDSKYNFNESEYFLDRPVYFGWGDAGKKGKLKPIAEEIFLNYEIAKTPIYNEDFTKNSFYHPGYVNRSYKKSAKTKNIMKEFYKLM